MMIGKIGYNYPVDSSKYKNLYIAMKVDSGPPAPWPDKFQIFWFADERANCPGCTFGYSQAITMYPEAGMSTPQPVWKLYKIDLSSNAVFWGGTPWNGYPLWKGLRIDPTFQSNINFQVDWIRLTDSHPVNFSITHAGGPNCSIWIRPEGTNREILVQNNISSPVYDLDLQGIAPGRYTYLIKDPNKVVKDMGEFEINQAPIVNFIRPSPANGDDSASNGLSWTMSDNSSVSFVDCAGYHFQDGLLHLSTPGIPQLSSSCIGGVVADPRIGLNLPTPFNPGEYRYLSFKIFTQNVINAQIVRWIWTVSGNGGNCYFVSQDMAIDVGWQTYTIDLFDAFNGSPEVVVGPCPYTSWRNSGTVSGLRFDPNENILGYPLVQAIDWIRLTKEDAVIKGTAYPVNFYLNKPPAGTNLTYFYTTNPQTQPFQQLARGILASPPLMNGNFKIYVPLLLNKYDPSNLPNPNSVNYVWDTSQVTPGTYYFCVSVNDTFNQIAFCSETPVRVK